MTDTSVVPVVPRWLPAPDLDRILDALRADGRTIIGPTVRDEAIVLDEILSAADLPTGWSAEASPGRYRVTRLHHARRFDHAVGPMSWKRWTFPPRIGSRVGRKTASGVRFTGIDPRPAPLAFIGVRACELTALQIQDHVLLDGQAIDADYRARRASAFVVAVECARPNSTCFCTSMGTGPEVTSGFDVALTELDDGFVVRAGSPAGVTLVAALDLPPADQSAIDAAAGVVAGARSAMGVPIDMSVVPGGLASAPEHPGWAAVAERCLSCTNCTLVCPTCFCSSVEEVTDLDGAHAERWREWDSCFSVDHSYIHGGAVRPSGRSRYPRRPRNPKFARSAQPRIWRGVLLGWTRGFTRTAGHRADRTHSADCCSGSRPNSTWGTAVSRRPTFAQQRSVLRQLPPTRWGWHGWASPRDQRRRHPERP
jgi:ferredoxin